ncbi:heme NO-binding domain-containing protein [Thiomicrorhabdus indica]|uniref:heme NO-binding domain-containing protein n=1 Tax=Thiomicrorhabdus indica TaxID=2267253 RepID=UPI002AA69121|nr:heme NO-binding domain-containing protein [Thiomicrorhabdus indica]
MRGLIFTQFLEMVENHYSADMVDDIIDDCDLPSGGSYTAVSKYNHQELHDLSVALAKRTEQTLSDILIEYGDYVFEPLYQHYQRLFKEKHSAIQFLLEVDSDIHKEMRKLYPDATLPNIDCSMQGETLVMRYQSDRHFADLVHGLILGCARYFNEPLHIEIPEFSSGQAEFHITPKG